MGLHKLISELVCLKLKEQTQSNQEEKTSVVAETHHNDQAHGTAVPKVNVDTATTPCSNKSTPKKSKNAKRNQEAPIDSASQMQAAQMTQWHQLQAAQMAQWQAAQVQ